MLAKSFDLAELVNAPLGDSLCSKQNEPRESAGPQASADREASDPIGDVKDSAFVVNIWRIFEKYCRIHILTRHIHSPALKYTERFGIEYGANAEINRRFINLAGFRRTAMFQRPTVSGPPDFANDNEPLREAA